MDRTQLNLYDYKLKVQSVESVNGSYAFRMQGKFIPLQTLRYPQSGSMGTLDGCELGPMNLLQVFQQYEAIQVMLQNLVFFDLKEFVLNAGVYVPETLNPAYNPATDNYFLFYLEPLS